MDRSALGERASGRDHLFVAMTGRGRASGGGRDCVAIQAGQAVYFPEAEGYLLFADPPGLTGVLIESEELSMLSRVLAAAISSLACARQALTSTGPTAGPPRAC